MGACLPPSHPCTQPPPTSAGTPPSSRRGCGSHCPPWTQSRQPPVSPGAAGTTAPGKWGHLTQAPCSVASSTCPRLAGGWRLKPWPLGHLSPPATWVQSSVSASYFTDSHRCSLFLHTHLRLPQSWDTHPTLGLGPRAWGLIILPLPCESWTRS